MISVINSSPRRIQNLSYGPSGASDIAPVKEKNVPGPQSLIHPRNPYQRRKRFRARSWNALNPFESRVIPKSCSPLVSRTRRRPSVLNNLNLLSATIDSKASYPEGGKPRSFSRGLYRSNIVSRSTSLSTKPILPEVFLTGQAKKSSVAVVEKPMCSKIFFEAIVGLDRRISEIEIRGAKEILSSWMIDLPRATLSPYFGLVRSPKRYIAFLIFPIDYQSVDSNTDASDNVVCVFGNHNKALFKVLQSFKEVFFESDEPIFPLLSRFLLYLEEPFVVIDCGEPYMYVSAFLFSINDSYLQVESNHSSIALKRFSLCTGRPPLESSWFSPLGKSTILASFPRYSNAVKNCIASGTQHL